MLVKQALKTGIAAAILAGIFQNSDLAHLQYPIYGFISVILSSNLGGVVKLGWARLGGSVVAGVLSALLISAFGSNPVTGAVTFIVASLLCEVYQWKSLTSQAGVLAALIASEPSLGQHPWQYTFDRVADNSIGVIIGTVVTILFWPDNPRETLQNNLVSVLQKCDRIFQSIIKSGVQGEKPLFTNDPLIAQISATVRESESLLEKSIYGFAGRSLVQDNWSHLISIQRRLKRHLLVMKQTFQADQPNQLINKFAEDLTHLAQEISGACTVMIASIQSGNSADLSISEILKLEEYIQNLTKEISQMRLQGEIRRFPLEETVQFYNFLHLLKDFTQEVEQLAIALCDRQKIGSQPSGQWSFKLHSLPAKQVKHIVKTGVAVGLTLAFINFAQLPFGYYAVIALVVSMQPTLGKSVDAGWQRVFCTGIGAIVAVVIVHSFGSNPVTVGLGVGLTILGCSYFGFNQGYKPGCFLVATSIMVHGSEPNSYIWWRFIETLLGIAIALPISLVVWPDTASQKLDLSLSQSLAKLGKLYQIVVNQYLQGLDKGEITTQLEAEIWQAIRTQTLLQEETKLELFEDLTASKKQRIWNFIISHEKTLFSNILSLENTVNQKTSDGFSQEFSEGLQQVVTKTAQNFQNLSSAVTHQNYQPQLLSLASNFEEIEKKLLQRRINNVVSSYSLDEIITFFTVFSSMKEIDNSIKQMADNWPFSDTSNSSTLLLTADS